MVVAVLDFFLREIPLINWLALSLSFLFFTGLLFESAAKSLVTEWKAPSKMMVGNEDELDLLERIVKGALVERRPQFMKSLQERLETIVNAARSLQSGYPAPVSEDNSSVPFSMSKDLVAQDLLADCSHAVGNSNSQHIQKVLAKVESWLS
jgi:hypothetical protein